MKLLLPLLLFFSYLGATSEYYLTACAIFQNEAKYLREWIDFHQIQGMEHFYLYNNFSTDDYMDVLKPFIDSKKVTLIEWPHEHRTDMEWIRVQCDAYMDCVHKIKEKAHWCAFIDIDEFMFSPEKHQLPIVLQAFEDCDAIGVNWVLYGSSGIFRIPLDEKITKYLVYRSKLEYPHNEIIKCIAKPSKILNCENPHYFLTKNNIFVDENKVLIRPPYRSKNSINKLRINHYWTRDLDYFFSVKIPRRLQTQMDKTINECLQIERSLNDVYDPILQNY